MQGDPNETASRHRTLHQSLVEPFFEFYKPLMLSKDHPEKQRHLLHRRREDFTPQRIELALNIDNFLIQCDRAEAPS